MLSLIRHAWPQADRTFAHVMEDMLDSIASVWSGLNAGRRTVVILATVAVFAAVLMMSRGIGSRDMSLLYASLENGAAGDVVTALEQQGVEYEVRGNAIFVPTVQRDQLRLTLASSGLPANSSQGYELLDTLSGFGTTSQMFDAAYWRAKEGELARTILASPHIRSARVHISTQAARPFQRENMATAAVTVGTVGGTLSPAQANALRYLVASSVSGLTPDNVAVIDGEGGLISGDDESGTPAGQGRAEELRQRAERILSARVGPGNAIVEVSVETITESEQIIERVIDPESRIAISTDVEERSSTSQDSRGGDVTVASNLPAGDGAGGDGTSATDDSETRSITNYEISETSREVLRAPGAVRRLTVAVLVNDAVAVAETGEETVVARDPEELAALGALVASAVGLDETRGDILTIRSMAFEPIEALGTEAIENTGSPLDLMSLIQIGVLAVVALILGLFVVRPILTTRAATTNLAGLPPPREDTFGADVMGPGNDSFGDLPSLPAMGGGDFDFDGVMGASDAGNDPVSRLRQMIDEREDETIQILQSWIEDPREKQGA